MTEQDKTVTYIIKEDGFIKSKDFTYRNGSTLGLKKEMFLSPDETAQWSNRNTYMWHDDNGNPEYKIIIWDRRR